MSNFIQANFIMMEKHYEQLIKNGRFNINCVEDEPDNAVGIWVEFELSHSRVYPELEDLLNFLEIPHDIHLDGSYDSAPCVRASRFEINKQTGFSEYKRTEWDKKDQFSFESGEIMQMINSNQIEEIKKTLTEKINSAQAIDLHKSNTPSKQRMIFLAVKHNYLETIQDLYEKSSDLVYKDKKTGKTTFDVFLENDIDKKITKLKSLEEINGELAARIKKDLLRESHKNMKVTHSYDIQGLSF